MTYREKKIFLESYQVSQRKIKGLQREIEQWETIATGITQKLSATATHTNGTTSKIENCAVKISEIERNIANELNIAKINREQVKTAIDNVKDVRKREILELKYINGLSVHRIAIDYDKADDNIYKMLRTAIKTMDI